MYYNAGAIYVAMMLRRKRGEIRHVDAGEKMYCDAGEKVIKLGEYSVIVILRSVMLERRWGR